MTKDIYIIKNDINDKVYIGQSINSELRFKEHCRLNNTISYIDRVISEKGKEHFWYEILENQIENYNEREKYWINYYNSIAPNGYNVAIGGEGILNGTQCMASLIKDENTLNNIIYDLKYTNLFYSDIAKKYNIENDVIICRINTGTCYRKPELEYPIRKERVDAKISNQQAQEIKKLLQNSCLTFSQIAKQYNISTAYVKNINAGKLKKDPNTKYPIRTGFITKNSLTDQELNEIYHLLINTDVSINQISKQYHRDRSVILGVKNGTTKAYRKEEYNYPLRPNNFKKPVSTISAKESTATIDT